MVATKTRESARMLLRLIRGDVAAGREADFVDVCRRQAIGRARAPGLVSFFAGYQRVDGHDRFVMAAVWDTEADAVNAGGEPNQPAVVEILAGVATVDSFDVYTVVDPAFRGIVDAPGGVVRITTARASAESGDAMFRWLAGQPRGRAGMAQRLLLGWALGRREVVGADEVEIVAVSAWPSPLVIEAVADPGRTGAPIFADIDQFNANVVVEQYQALAFDLPDALSDAASRRVI